MSNVTACWYSQELSDSEKANALVSHVEGLRVNDLSTWRTDVRYYQKLYAGTQNVSGTQTFITDVPLRYNICKAVVDTAVSILTAARTLPYFDTRGGEWLERRKATNCNQVLQSQFQQIEVFEESQKVIKDALVSKLGVLKFYQDATKKGAKPSCERKIPLSVLWDPGEALHGKPSSIFEIGFWNKDKLKSLYPHLASEIDAAPGPSELDREDFAFETLGGRSANQVAVYEGWHLPSSAEANDGYHMMCIAGAKLFSENWTSPRFPFAFLHGWTPNVSGFVGESLVQLAEPHQRIIIEAIEAVHANQKGSNTYAILHGKGSLAPEQLDNSALRILRNVPDASQPPGSTAVEWHTVNATPQDLQQQIDLEYARCLTMLGLSPQQAQGEKPANISSAVGLKAMEDIQSKRHVPNIRYVEAYYLEASQCLVDVNRQISANPKAPFQIDYRSRKNFIEQVKWTDVDVGESVRLNVLPVSQLMGSVSAQLDTTEQWVRSGWCDQSTAKMLFNMPDTEGQSNTDTEDVTFAYDQIEDVLEGKQVVIDTYQNLAVLIKYMRTEYLAAKRDKAPTPILNEFRRVMDYAGPLVQQAMKANAEPTVNSINQLTRDTAAQLAASGNQAPQQNAS